MTRPRVTGPGIVFGVAGWCRLLGHACTIPDCPCDCHRLSAPLRSLPLPGSAR